MRKAIKWIGITILVIILGMQLVQPERTNPPVDESKTIFAHVNVPPDVKAILERSCFDCHSNQTKWPWYSYIAPTSWLVAGDVKEGRAHLNLTQWGDYNDLKQIAKLDQMCQEVLDDKMPIKPYRMMHSDAALSKTEVDLLCDWVETERDRLMAPDTTETTGQ